MNRKFQPFVRYIAKSTYFIGNKFLIGNDCRLLYIISGSGYLKCLNNSYQLSAGALIYYPAATPYQIISSKDNKLFFYTLNFDFSDKYADILPMPPQDYKDYSPQKILLTQNEYQFEVFKNIIYLPSAINYEEQLDTLYQEYMLKKTDHIELESAIMKIILINIYRDAVTSHESSISKQIKLILSKNINLSNKEIADMLNYHPFYLNKLFKNEKGITLHQFVIRQKLAKAYSLITSTQMSLEEISFVCGFSSQSHLTSAFKKTYNASPAQIRKMI